MGENKHNTTKNKVHVVYFFKLVICPVVRVSIRIFNLTSQIDIEWCRLCCFMGDRFMVWVSTVLKTMG